MNLEQARFNMVEQQIRTWEVLDQDVLGLLLEVRREEFLPPAVSSLAFADMEIPLGHGEVMLAPKLEARMLQELAVKSTDKVLEVGSGSGYMTALLAKRAAFVVSVDILAELSAFAAKNLAAHRIDNVQLHVGDAAHGWLGGPYDVIALTGSTPILAHAFLSLLNPGGRLLAVIGDAPVMKATLFTASGRDEVASVELFETCIPPLRNAPQPKRFVF
ncbi:MAG: protein-L-isoaspartate O-methyltransferase [Burkholderiales bacterium]|nr:protein-L-isoaspartate O-methyltransferase [Burkholderiales bacterium]